MRYAAVISLILLTSPAAWAQAYPPQYQAPASQEQQVNANLYAAQPYYAPSTGGVVAEPSAQPIQQAPQAPQYEPRPGEYGQSIITDIRQMNF